MLAHRLRVALWLVAILFVVLPSNRGAAEEDPRRPAAIVTQNVPAIPGAIWERLRQYQAARSAVFRGWAPDGRGLLIATRFGETAQLHRVYEPGGRREQVTFFEEPVDGGFLPKDPSGNLLLRSSVGGSENDQLFLFERATGRTSRLTDGTSRHLLMAISRDGGLGVIGHNGRNGRDTDLYLFKPREAGAQPFVPLLEVTGKFLYATDWSPNAQTLLLMETVSANLSYPHLFDVASRKQTALPIPTSTGSSQPVPNGGKVKFENLLFSADGTAVYLTCDAWGEFRELARYDLQTRQYTRLSSDIPWDVGDVIVDESSGRVAFTVNADGVDRLYLLEGETRKELALPSPGLVAGLEFSPDGRSLGLTIARAQAPADVFSIELASVKTTRWTFSEVGGLDTEQFLAPTLVRFPSFDGREIPAYITRPAEVKSEDKAAEKTAATASPPFPVLIDIHGGPEGQYRPFFSGVDQFLVRELGVAVIHPNVRGSEGYGKTYLTLDNGPLREDSVRDIGALLDWIATQPDLDSRRVAVYGVSYGGYMALASLVYYSDRLRGGIDVVGIGDFETFLKTTAAYRRDLRRVEYGDERDPAMLELFAKISPLRNADRIRSSLMVVHGRNDPRVPFSEAEQIAARVTAQGQSVWTVYADNEGHGFAKKPNRDYQTGAMVMFLKNCFDRPAAGKQP